ncbi:hypothetical protein AQ614_02150 [Enterococcus faecium]|nr:hypothetical protein AQ614_02150 [Enterococcus faecium]
MKDLRYRSVFDIIGPVMIGPSSSHTAGAARIGKIIRSIFGEQPDSVDIYLPVVLVNFFLEENV